MPMFFNLFAAAEALTNVKIKTPCIYAMTHESSGTGEVFVRVSGDRCPQKSQNREPVGSGAKFSKLFLETF